MNFVNGLRPPTSEHYMFTEATFCSFSYFHPLAPHMEMKMAARKSIISAESKPPPAAAPSSGSDDIERRAELLMGSLFWALFVSTCAQNGARSSLPSLSSSTRRDRPWTFQLRYPDGQKIGSRSDPFGPEGGAERMRHGAGRSN